MTDFNHAIAQLHLGRVDTVRWRNGSFDESGVITYPPYFDATRKADPSHVFPMVLRIHGGPTLTSEAMFDPFYQLAASHGYLVFAPNYRGSSDCRNAFEHAVYNDASVGPGQRHHGRHRRSRKTRHRRRVAVGVSGWSYGGQLTSWMIGHYQIWKCAVTGAAVNELVVDYTIADDIDADRVSFSDSPFVGNGLAAWQAQSPITYFKDIHTPLLMFGNVYDVRVPIVEQYEMYHALRDNGVPVQFFAYPAGAIFRAVRFDSRTRTGAGSRGSTGTSAMKRRSALLSSALLRWRSAAAPAAADVHARRLSAVRTIRSQRHLARPRAAAGRRRGDSRRRVGLQWAAQLLAVTGQSVRRARQRRRVACVRFESLRQGVLPVRPILRPCRRSSSRRVLRARKSTVVRAHR